MVVVIGLQPLYFNTFASNSTDGDIGTPLVIIDGPSGVVEVGEELNLTCYAMNSEGLIMRWFKNGQLLPEGRETSVVDKFLGFIQRVEHLGTSQPGISHPQSKFNP